MNARQIDILARLQRISALPLAFFAFWFGYFSWFWSQALHVDASGALVAAHANLWADWAIHFTMGTGMAYRELLLDSSPLMLGEDFVYPFASNLISALLLRAGVSQIAAFVIPSYLCSLLLVAVLFYFFKTVFRSATVAVLGASLFLLDGGTGFFHFIQDLLASPTPWQLLADPPQSYTNWPEQHYVWASVIDTMIIPQRAFNHGLPLALLALTLVYSATLAPARDATASARRKLITAALILGILPLLHTHSFLAAFIVLCGWSAAAIFFTRAQPLSARFKPWLLLGTLTTLIALPILLAYFVGHVAHGFTQWHPG